MVMRRRGLGSSVFSRGYACEMPAIPEFDSFDRRILAELLGDARISWAELGRRVHLSQPAVTERVRKLEGAGVIQGYHAQVDAKALGYGIRALVRVGRTDYVAILRLIEGMSECLNAWNITGEDSWMLEIAVVDVAHLDGVVSRLCELCETSTSIVLKTVLQHRAMLPPPTGAAPALEAGAMTEQETP